MPGAGDPQFTTEGIGRADVWVFDSTSLGATVGGTPIEILTFFADTPRALAVSNDGNTVYVAAFHSGNQTSIVRMSSMGACLLVKEAGAEPLLQVVVRDRNAVRQDGHCLPGLAEYIDLLRAVYGASESFEGAEQRGEALPPFFLRKHADPTPRKGPRWR